MSEEIDQKNGNRAKRQEQRQKLKEKIIELERKLAEKDDEIQNLKKRLDETDGDDRSR